MGSTAVEDLIESSSGVHFSGFHLGNTEPKVSVIEDPTTSATKNVKQPFVIGVAGGVRVYMWLIKAVHLLPKFFYGEVIRFELKEGEETVEFSSCKGVV